MGRCYEFGVSIRDGCEHAMVVPAEGGRCECVGCGTPCTGRFKGCTAIISVGGYVPTTAPAWSLRRPEPLPTATAVTGPTVALLPPPPPSPPAPVLAERDDDVITRVQASLDELGRQIEARDAELGALFDRFVDEFTRLRDEISSLGSTTSLLRSRVDDLTERLDRMVAASLLGPIQRDG